MATDDDIAGVRAKLELKLHGLSTRMQGEAGDFSDELTDALVEALAQIPGAKDAAAAVVSGAMYRGLGATFDKYSDEISTSDVEGQGGDGWEYTAVMDGGTCEECASHDGEQYDTWEEIAGPGGPLPDGGPNPDCYGEDRCRCRASIA